MATDDEDIGRRISERRRDLGMDQSELSALLREAGLNWSQGTLSRVENGQRSVRANEIMPLAIALKTQVLALLRDSDFIPEARRLGTSEVWRSANALYDAWAQFQHFRLRLQAAFALELASRGEASGVVVNGCGADGLLRAVIDFPADGRTEARSIMRALGIESEAEGLYARARELAARLVEDPLEAWTIAKEVNPDEDVAEGLYQTLRTYVPESGYAAGPEEERWSTDCIFDSLIIEPITSRLLELGMSFEHVEERLETPRSISGLNASFFDTVELTPPNLHEGLDEWQEMNLRRRQADSDAP